MITSYSSSFLDLVEIFLCWVGNSYLEILATITGLIYLFYSIKGKNQLWIYGFISSGLYVYICYVAGIYADMAINIYYVFVSIYGYVHWKFYHSRGKEELLVSRLKSKETIIVILVTSMVYSFIAFVLIHFTDSTIPYWDAFTTSASITATWMLARKIMEHWLIWIVVDAVSIGLYVFKHLYITSFLFSVYTIMAVIGFIQWRRQWKKQEVTL